MFSRVCVCVCLPVTLERSGPGLPPGRSPQEPPLPLPLRTGCGSFWPPGPAIQVVSPEQSAFLTGPKSWGREVQILEWAGRLYQDFLGLSGETCFFPVRF